MKSKNAIKPLKFWQSVLLFMIPALFALIVQYILWPYLVRIGLSQENAYNSAHLLVFIGLLLATLTALRLERWPLEWAAVKERLRLGAMTWKQWMIPFIAQRLKNTTPAMSIRRSVLLNPGNQETQEEWSQSVGRIDTLIELYESGNVLLTPPIVIDTWGDIFKIPVK